MGYDIYITRRQKTGQLISEEEWQTLVSADPEFKVAGVVKAELPSGQELAYTNLLLVFWSGHPDGSPVPFDFRRGKVVVKNPDKSTLNKMRQIASLLNARVQGDEGELYDFGK